VRSNPGRRGGQIAVVLGTDTATARLVVKRLIKTGLVKTSGQVRVMS